jgi:hypothetical protein
MATTEPSSITNLPPTGLPLREALERHCPFWPEHRRYEMLRIRIGVGVDRLPDDIESAWQLATETEAAWLHVVTWIRNVLDSGAWELWASEKLTGELEPVLRAAVWHLMFEPDFTARGPDGQVLRGLHVYSPSTKTTNPPLLVKHEGPLEVIEQRDDVSPHYRHIRAMAEDAFPKGWQHQRQNVVLKGVADQFQRHREPVPERQMLLRALGYRKR